MIVIPILLVVVAALAVWIVRVAGWRFALQRLGGALLVVVLVTLATSFLLRQTSIDEQQTAALEALGLPATAQPCVSALGTGADVPTVVECVDERGLDDNLFVQCVCWAGDLVRGDLGYAFYKNREPLTDTIQQRMPRTAWLFLYSQLIALALAVPLGIWSAYQASRNGRTTPRWVLPVFVVGMLALSFWRGWGFAAVLVIAIVEVGVPALDHEGEGERFARLKVARVELDRPTAGAHAASLVILVLPGDGGAGAHHQLGGLQSITDDDGLGCLAEGGRRAEQQGAQQEQAEWGVKTQSHASHSSTERGPAWIPGRSRRLRRSRRLALLDRPGCRSVTT